MYTLPFSKKKEEFKKKKRKKKEKEQILINDIESVTVTERN